MHNSPQSPNNGQNVDGGISDFWISGQSFINGNCHNSRTSYYIFMKLGPVTKIDKRNTETAKKKKKIDYGAMSANSDVTVIFLIYGQFGAIRSANSERMVCKIYILSNSNVLSYRN